MNKRQTLMQLLTIERRAYAYVDICGPESVPEAVSKLMKARSELYHFCVEYAKDTLLPEEAQDAKDR